MSIINSRLASEATAELFGRVGVPDHLKMPVGVRHRFDDRATVWTVMMLAHERIKAVMEWPRRLSKSTFWSSASVDSLLDHLRGLTSAPNRRIKSFAPDSASRRNADRPSSRRAFARACRSIRGFATVPPIGTGT
jgi:hypothetical protein